MPATTTPLAHLAELAQAAADIHDALPADPSAAELDQMLTTAAALGAAADHVLAHVAETTRSKARHATVARSIGLARDCVRWMCADIDSAAAALTGEHVRIR